MAATLNVDEVQALMTAIQDGRVKPESNGGARGPVTPYDLTSRDRVIRGQMPTLDAINERIASLLGVGLAGRTRLSLRVASAPSTLLKFVDFNSMMAPPATVCVLSLGSRHGPANLVLEPGLADSLLAAALGDRKLRADDAVREARRELTSVEKRVLKRLLGVFTDAMASAWTPVIDFRPEVQRFESDARMAVIAPPNETAILSSFEITGALTGRLQLGIPFAAVETVKKVLSSPPRANVGSDERFTNALSRELEQVEVSVSAIFGKANSTVSRLLEMEVGDLLVLDTYEGAELPICIEGKPKLTGSPRINGGNMAVVVHHALQPSEPKAAQSPAPAPVRLTSTR